MKLTENIARRSFMRNSVQAGALIAASQSAGIAIAQDRPNPVRVGMIGCGDVSRYYFAHLGQCEYAKIVSVCDIVFERAQRAAERYDVPNAYSHIDEMLDGEPFDLFVNLTDMQEHERLNWLAIEAGKHVFCEKPFVNSHVTGQELLNLAQERGLRIWGAPTAVNSPQFAFMSRTLGDKTLGRVAAAHASYGHLGPNWASFYFEENGGGLPDLGVYNLTTLTGLLGPARSVVAMTSIVTPTRSIRDKGEIETEIEDNAMVIIEHDNNALSHMQCGFNFFTSQEHSHTSRNHHTVTILGSGGSMGLAGYDWAPHAVDVATLENHSFQRFAAEEHDYVWENGASLAAECLATGKEPSFTPEHALHVVEIINAANESQKTGRRIEIQSTFDPM